MSIAMAQTPTKKRRRGRPSAKAKGRFGKLLVAALNEAGMTQSELSERTAIPQPRISDYCRGVHSPSLKALRRIAKALGTTIEHLGFVVTRLETIKPKDETT